MICHRHHNAVHEGGWALSGSATDLTWSDPHGRRYRAPVTTATVPPWARGLAELAPAWPEPPF